MHPPSPPPVAGDFFALLQQQQVPLPRIDPSLAATLTEATTVFAFHWAGGVLMAGDRRATAGNVIVTDEVDKVLELDSTSLLAIAGVPATAFEMARALQTAFAYYRRSQLQTLSLPARVRALSRALRDNLPLTLQGVGAVAPLFAGLDTSTSPPQPRIFFYDPLGAQFLAARFAASGSGAPYVRSILEFQHRFASTPPELLDRPAAIRFALHLLMTAAHFDAATGGVQPETGRFATLRLLTPNGTLPVPPEEQTAALAPS